MNILENLQHIILTHIQQTYNITIETCKKIDITINTDDKKADFGDITTNAALIIAQEIGTNPRTVAQALAASLSHPHIQKIDIAGPGFINIFLTIQAFKVLTQELYHQDKDFFKPTIIKPLTYSLEFVSANPTGPLHIGHGRGGIIGDVLAQVLRFLGHNVITEYYINDAGNQIGKLGLSLKIRCLQQNGSNEQLPEDAYQGEYLIRLAEQCIAEYGNQVIEQPQTFFEEYAQKHLLQNITETLRSYGIEFDIWFSEKTLHTSGAIQKELEYLASRGYTYKKDDALWFTAMQFGDDKDRVVQKNTGELTYIAADIAYLQNKLQRPADHLIMILGQDHHSYVARLKAIMQALGHNPDTLDVILYQLVTVKETGELVRLSKRAGKIVSLNDIIETVGKDVARFFYLNRKADAHLDFDITLALEHSEKNPVYYIQYAYVRAGSILEKASEHAEFAFGPEDIAYIGAPEVALLKKIAALKDVLENIGRTYQTHVLSYYLLELAHHFHHYYSSNRVITHEDPGLTKSRLLIVSIAQRTFKHVLELLGLTTPESM
ncbi:MAG: arginine--tRNA ligase [Candidatus Babeliaceae bacterium]|jgi:arginyl-tRNA synthetase